MKTDEKSKVGSTIDEAEKGDFTIIKVEYPPKIHHVHVNSSDSLFELGYIDDYFE